MKIHLAKSELAGKTVRIKADAKHHLYIIAGEEFQVLDWFDRYFGKVAFAAVREECAFGPPEILIYKARWARFLAGYLPIDQENEILVGLIRGNRIVVHISELDLTPGPSPTLPLAA